MTGQELSHLIERAREFPLTSMEHVDVETLGAVSVIRSEDTALIIRSLMNGRTYLHWAVSNGHELVSSIVSLLNTGLIEEGVEVEFVPESCVGSLEQIGFSVLSEWVDYWQSPLKPIEIELPEGLIIRPIGQEEYAGASVIMRRCEGLSRGYLGETSQWLRQWNEQEHSVVYVALLDNALIGLCCMAVYGFDNPDGPTMWLRQLAVNPLCHSRRIGLSLTVEALQWGAKQGAERSFLACDAENERAIRLYEGLGYERACGRGQINMVLRNRLIADTRC